MKSFVKDGWMALIGAILLFFLVWVVIFLIPTAKAAVYDFDRADQLGLPPWYRFEQIENTYFGKLSKACSGAECKGANFVLFHPITGLK